MTLSAAFMTLVIRSRFLFRFRTSISVWAFLSAFQMLAVPAAEAATGLSESQGELVLIGLDTGEQITGAATGLPRILALATCNTSEIFAAVADLSGDQLFLLDPQTGASSIIDSFPPGIATEDLTCDADGNLWLLSRGEVYAVDTASANTTLVGGGDLHGIAASGNVLYSIREIVFGPDHLVTFDPQTGNSTLVAELSGDPIDGALEAMDFDTFGSLWLLSFSFQFPAPFDSQQILQIHDLESGFLQERAFFSTSFGQELRSLSIGPGPFDRPIEIPTLSSVALMALPLLLGITGLWFVSRATGSNRSG